MDGIKIMKLFKDNQNNIFAYELDGSQDHLIEDKISITKDEADQIIFQKEKSNFDNLTYDKKRIAEYPPITDYLDGLVKGDQEQMNKYISDCLAVKSKYPKI